MKNITGYLVVTVCSLLLFLLVFLLLVRYKKNIRASLEKDSWFSRIISRNVVIKTGLAWVCILLLRKLIYYVPLQGVIQTKLSVWWADDTVLITIYCVSVGSLIGAHLIKAIRIIWQSSEEGASLLKILIPSSNSNFGKFRGSHGELPLQIPQIFADYRGFYGV